MKSSKSPDTVDGYIENFPVHIQEKLKEMRSAIKNAVPGAVEKISYQMPAFLMNGVLVYFAGYTNHIGFYPLASGVKEFKQELGGFKTSKGTIQFPVDKPLPLDLITKIVLFRLNENLKKAERKTNRK